MFLDMQRTSSKKIRHKESVIILRKISSQRLEILHGEGKWRVQVEMRRSWMFRGWSLVVVDVIMV